MTGTPSAGRLVIAAATFNRPQGLMRLLDGIGALRFSPQTALPTIEVVIVDNSVDGNARAAVEGRAAGYRFPLHYAHARERGIAQARNRALDEASARGADWLAFIDDDEAPHPDWLDRMLAVAAAHEAEIVVGALLPEFVTPPPAWLERGGFLAINAHQDGEPIPIGNTSNVLFDLAFANRHGVRFDLAFALTGGEDTLFFDELVRHGATMVFCRSGVVYETIAPVRNTLGWNASRWVRSGNTDGRIVMLRRPGRGARFGTVLGGGLARLAIGGGRALVSSPLAAFGRPEVPAEELRIACRGIGFIRAAFGNVIEEYRTHER